MMLGGKGTYNCVSDADNASDFIGVIAGQAIQHHRSEDLQGQL